MITFQITVLKLLCKILRSVQQAPGVASYEEDDIFIDKVKNIIKNTEKLKDGRREI